MFLYRLLLKIYKFTFMFSFISHYFYLPSLINIETSNMLSASTVQILKRLSPTELKRFRDFINSPYHNSSSSLEKIYQVVLKAGPDYTSPSLEYKNIWKKIFPTEEYKDKRLKNLYADFSTILKKFIGYEELANKSYELDLFIAESLSSRNLFDASEKFIKKSVAKNHNGLITDYIKLFYNQRISILQRRNIYQHTNKSDKDYRDILTIISESMIARFLRITYTEAYTVATEEAIAFEEGIMMTDAFLDAFDMEKFLETLKQENHKYYSYLKINYMLYYHMKFDISEEQLYDLKNEIFNIIHKVEKWEAFTFIFRTIDIILVRLVRSDSKYYRDIFDFANLFIELKIFPDDLGNVFTIGCFRDAFMPAIILKEYDWAEKFAVEYTSYLAEELRESELNYCMGILSFKKGKFEESLNYLNKLKLTHIVQKISIRFYYLMNYIELKAYESALSAVQTLRQYYIDNKDMPELFTVNFSESLKYFHEIIKCEMDGKKIDGFLYETAKNGKSFNHRQYILEKMQQLL